jgi:hypothetical protein
MWWMLVAGCDVFEKAKQVADAIEGLTNPLVLQAIVLSVEDPGDPTVADVLTASGTEIGTGATVFLADAASAGELADAPIPGGSVTVGGVTATDQGDGAYVVDPSMGLAYEAGETLSVRTFPLPDSDESVATVIQPPPVEIEWPETLDLGQPFLFDLTDQGFDGTVILVLDAQGAPTYSNEPKTVEDVYNATASEAPLGAVEIPASAFPAEGVYVVGIAGLVGTKAPDLVEVNTALSNLSAGQFAFRAVSVLPTVP